MRPSGAVRGPRDDASCPRNDTSCPHRPTPRSHQLMHGPAVLRAALPHAHFNNIVGCGASAISPSRTPATPHRHIERVQRPYCMRRAPDRPRFLLYRAPAWRCRARALLFGACKHAPGSPCSDLRRSHSPIAICTFPCRLQAPPPLPPHTAICASCCVLSMLHAAVCDPQRHLHATPHALDAPLGPPPLSACPSARHVAPTPLSFGPTGPSYAPHRHLHAPCRRLRAPWAVFVPTPPSSRPVASMAPTSRPRAPPPSARPMALSSHCRPPCAPPTVIALVLRRAGGASETARALVRVSGTPPCHSRPPPQRLHIANSSLRAVFTACDHPPSPPPIDLPRLHTAQQDDFAPTHCCFALTSARPCGPRTAPTPLLPRLRHPRTPAPPCSPSPSLGLAPQIPLLSLAVAPLHRRTLPHHRCSPSQRRAASTHPAPPSRPLCDAVARLRDTHHLLPPSRALAFALSLLLPAVAPSSRTSSALAH
ncbi:hypothetical protein DENSPDRAFT_885464 [Dentipellis sp. KUC8613]|nr:hypothetical protein DENSPDRAFT_885464 [Dentipellis sp. KUC8613]